MACTRPYTAAMSLILSKLCARLGAAALFIFVSISSGQAAERIRYEDLPYHLARFGSMLEHRGFSVTTLDGKRHSGRRLLLESDHVRIFHRDQSWEDLAGDEISRIEIRQTGRFFHHVGDGLGFILLPMMFAGNQDANTAACYMAAVIAIPPTAAYTAVTAPVFLTLDVVAFFVPAKVFEIAH
jgi:hypothetical protein